MEKKSLLSLSPIGFHKIAYMEWGSIDAPRTIICVPGLTRNSRDFDILAQELGVRNNARIICPDLPGRGESAWLGDSRYYNHQQYIIDLTALIARLNVASVTWIGTSIGGLLGMYLAAQINTPIDSLVLNDVGPVIPRAAVARISKYTKKNKNFLNLDAAQNYLRSIYGSGEKLSDNIWQQITLNSVIQQQDGSFALAYDPKIVRNIPKFLFFDIKLWGLWKRINCPVLVLRGQYSDVLLKTTSEQMREIGPKTEIVEIHNCGHAPMLMTQDQIKIISNWLNHN